jgi:hypothetical protein
VSTFFKKKNRLKVNLRGFHLRPALSKAPEARFAWSTRPVEELSSYESKDFAPSGLSTLLGVLGGVKKGLLLPFSDSSIFCSLAKSEPTRIAAASAFMALLVGLASALLLSPVHSGESAFSLAGSSLKRLL